MCKNKVVIRKVCLYVEALHVGSVRYGSLNKDLDADGWGRTEACLHDCAEDAGTACWRICQ